MKNTFRKLITLHSTNEDLALHLQCNSAKKGNHTLTYLFAVCRVVLAACTYTSTTIFKKYIFLKILQLTYYYVLFLLLLITCTWSNLKFFKLYTQLQSFKYP